jgi:feruloyl esterase
MNTKTIPLAALFGSLFLAAAAPQSAARASRTGDAGGQHCRALAAMVLPGAKVTASEAVPAGAFRLGRASMLPDFAKRLETAPAFCRIVIVATPSPQSRIGIEVWLPERQWNGRFLGTGNGGGGGMIAYEMGMVEGLKRGFAVANTDMGTAPDINETFREPERWTDFGYRGTHEMTRLAKLVVRSYYNVSAFRSYFAGCSTGGQQALSAAQRYPADYDGILAGDPGNNRTHVAASFVWNYAALTAAPGAALSPAKWSTVSGSVISACAGKDGGAPGDRFLTDPRLCKFDAGSLPTCRAGSGPEECFSTSQIAMLRRLYSGPVNPATGEQIYPGMTLGSEDQPLGPILQASAEWPGQQFYLFRWALGSRFTASAFDFDRDLDRVDARLAGTLNANSPDLSDFARRGGKLVLYTGIADPAVPIAEVVNYYDRVVTAAGGAGEAESFARLFLVPGMGHCFGGPGVTGMGQLGEELPETRDSDILMQLVGWTERGTMPGQILARKPAGNGHPAQERPVCTYPALPEYRGGDPAKAASFACTPRARGAKQVPAARYLN